MGDSFDIDFKGLPPELQVKLWLLSLDADTSKVTLAFNPGKYVMNLGYNYGGAIEGSFMYRRVITAKLGVNPSDGGLDLGLVFRGFNFKATTNFIQPTVGIGLTYGASLLPYPAELGSTFASAAGGIQNMAGNLGSLPNNPLDWYKLHSDDVDSVSKAIKTGQQIAKSGKDTQRFGAGLRLNYGSGTGLTIWGGALFRF